MVTEDPVPVVLVVPPDVVVLPEVVVLVLVDPVVKVPVPETTASSLKSLMFLDSSISALVEGGTNPRTLHGICYGKFSH
jgi:hypothetical protein